MNKLNAALFVLGICSSFVVAAADSGAYLGATVGISHFDLNHLGRGRLGFSDNYGSDTDLTWGAEIGYRFPYVALEAGYIDFGGGAFKSTTRHAFIGAIYDDISGEFSTKGPVLAVIGILPINNFEVSLKVGEFFAKTSLDARFRGQTSFSFPSPAPIEQFLSASSNSVEVLTGLGFGYTIRDHFHLRLDWTFVPNVGDEEDTAEVDVSSLSLGFQYRF